MKKDNKKKKVVTIVVSILIVLMLVLATSYAYFSTQLAGKDQIVKVGQLELVLNETSEGITLDNAIGISDEEGMGLTPSTFELKNNGNNAVDYTIYLDDNTISDTDIRIDDMYLKYNLNKNGTDSGATLLTTTGTNPNRILDSGTIAGGDTNTYSLNLWITDEVDGNYSGQVFSGKLRVEVSQERPTVSEVILADSSNNVNTDDPEQTFITGSNPNNYIWYSGKLWRAVSIDPVDNSVKLVTQWNISSVPYDDNSSAFEGSYMEEWLNDTSVDGFLGNLREPEKFIKMDSKWNATMMSDNSKPPSESEGGTIVENPVGLINYYESAKASKIRGVGLSWYLLTPATSKAIRRVDTGGWAEGTTSVSSDALGVRPSINLNSNIKISGGSGTVDDPYRLFGDDDKALSGVPLSVRYSGEYIRFGSGENNLYRIVSHETNGLTKITSAEPLRENGNFKTIQLGSVKYSNTIGIGAFLNGEYLTSYVGDSYNNMIEDNTIWYLGTVNNGKSYRLAKYADTTSNNFVSSTTTAKVGLLRVGELMSGQFDSYRNNAEYWLITLNSASNVNKINGLGNIYFGGISANNAIKPALNLKSNVIITSGTGTKEDPFEVELLS